MSIPLLSFVALLGASQGALLGVVLLSLQKGRRLANRLLACFLFAESIRLGVLMFTYGDWVMSPPWLYLLLNVTYAIGPLLYGYTMAMTQPGFRLTPVFVWHLLPMLVAAAACAGIFLVTDFSAIDPQQPESTRIYWWGIVMSVFGFISLLVYSIKSLGLLKPYQQIITAQFSDIEKINLRWLKLLIVFCLVTAAVSATVELMRLATPLNMGPRILASLLMSVMMIYGIGIMGIRQPAILGSGEWSLEAANNIHKATDNNHKKPATDNKKSASEKYLKSGLSQQESEIFWGKLQQHMTSNKPYLENGLKLSELAEQMDLLPNHLSQVINTHGGCSFFDFINSYRVEAAKQLLASESKQRFSVATIALEAGFNSQNTFYNQFKKHTGTTPSKYKKNVTLAGK